MMEYGILEKDKSGKRLMWSKSKLWALAQHLERGQDLILTVKRSEGSIIMCFINSQWETEEKREILFCHRLTSKATLECFKTWVSEWPSQFPAFIQQQICNKMLKISMNSNSGASCRTTCCGKVQGGEYL